MRNEIQKDSMEEYFLKLSREERNEIAKDSNTSIEMLEYLSKDRYEIIRESVKINPTYVEYKDNEEINFSESRDKLPTLSTNLDIEDTKSSNKPKNQR